MRPFGESAIHKFNDLQSQLRIEIDRLKNEYVLGVSATELESHYLDKGLIEPLSLDIEGQYIKSETATTVDVSRDINRAGSRRGRPLMVSGTQLQIAVPFDGDPFLWRLQPNTFSVSGHPEIEVQGNEVVIEIVFPDDSADKDGLKARIDRDVNALANSVGHLAANVETHNQEIRRIVPEAITRKREKALSATNAVASLGIPMQRADRPATYTLPVRRRPNPVRRPAVTTEPFEPEPALDMAEYEYILSEMRNMSLVIERNPTSFATLREEAIRDHFLLRLNSSYEGGATGETFNAHGRTDILIRAGERTAFIAECKFWRGPKKLDEAVTQLLSYLAWRDTKSAILVFNKNRDSSAVREKMHDVIVNRPEHRKTLIHDPDGDSRYVLVKEDDPGREIILTTQIYDVPSGPKRRSQDA